MVDRINAVIAKHICGWRAGEKAGEGFIEDVEAASVGAEGRYDEALSVSDEASASDAAPATDDPCRRMKVAGDLARHRPRRRFVPQ